LGKGYLCVEDSLDTHTFSASRAERLMQGPLFKVSLLCGSLWHCFAVVDAQVYFSTYVHSRDPVVKALAR